MQEYYDYKYKYVLLFIGMMMQLMSWWFASSKNVIVKGDIHA